MVGMIGGMLAVMFMPLVDRMKIDDPVGAVSVHGVGGLWGVLAIGLFVDADSLEKITNGRSGLFKGRRENDPTVFILQVVGDAGHNRRHSS